MGKSIQISDRISLPADAVTQTLACIGRKGAGKTYLATKLAEEMLDLPAQIVVIDPVGNWFGLRVAADGKGKGKDIFIAGGEHGDVPLAPEVGAVMARTVVNKGISIVLDVSGFRQGERKRFAADFAEEFFHLKKKQRSAVHLFVEEAQLFAPQRTGPDEARMLGAFENIIRLGRNYGIGATLITQRPQSVNKEVLSQVECLCVLQVNGAHERKAIEEWVQEKGADRKLVGDLPGLARGEGFVWSPSWLRVFERVQFGNKTTFDASATPEVGRATKTTMLSAMDVDALKADLKDVIARAESEDPKALRRRIAELERDVKSRPIEQKAVAVMPDRDAARKIIDSEIEEFYRRAQKDIGARIAGELRTLIGETSKHLDYLANFAGILSNPEKWKAPPMSRASVEMAKSVPMVPKFAPQAERPKLPQPKQPAPEGIGKAQLRIISRLAELLAVTGKDSVLKEQLAAWSEYSPTGGGFNNYLGQLRSAGLIEYPAPGSVNLTANGADVAEPEQVPTTNAAMLERAERVLGGSEAKLLHYAAQAWPRAIPKEALAEATGFSVTGGGFNNYLGRMRTLGFIDYPQRGHVKASDWLFIEEARA